IWQQYRLHNSHVGVCMRLIIFSAGVVVLFVSTLTAQSQLGTGAISGTIQDPSGAVIPGARITITQNETGLTREVFSAEAGKFLVPVLPTGTYRVQVVKQGFGTMNRDAVVVNVGGTADLILILSLGDVEESVSVTAASVALDTAQTDISSLIDRTQIQDLPINGRRYYDFALL